MLNRGPTSNFVLNWEKRQRRLLTCCLRYTAILACLGQESLSGISGLWMVGWVWRDDAKPGRPCSVKTDVNIEKVWELVRTDRRLTIRMMADQLGIDKELVRSILVDNLGMRKVCAKMVPRLLSEDQKTRRLHVCQDILQQLQTADGRHTLRKGHHRWRIVDFWIWPRNKASELSVEVARLTKTKEGPNAEVPSEGNVDHLLWPPRHGPSWICTTRSDSKPAFLQRGTDPVDGKNSAQEKGVVGVQHLDSAPRQCPSTRSPQCQAVPGHQTGHHSWPPSLFARLGSVWLFFISEAERDNQGDSFWRSGGYQVQCDVIFEENHEGGLCRMFPGVEKADGEVHWSPRGLLWRK